MRNEFGRRFRAVVRAVGAAALACGMIAAAPKISEANPKYAAIVVDTATGKVLYESNADARRYPASLTKMMTLYVLFEDLERGRFRLDSPLQVSANAARQAPSKLGLKAGSTITVEQAIKALVTKSANDAAATVAENLAGSVPRFAERMTRTARAIGMGQTRFRNAHGLPDPGQYTTARDMMKLGVALQVRFPRYYTFFQTRSFNFRGRVHGNHNNLLGRVEGVDGIKTGYINASGFNLVSSVKRDGRKIVAVVMGGRTARSRDAHMVQLIETYLPKASRGRGYASDLVAAVKAAPSVAASSPHPEPAVIAALAGHPRPPARPPVPTAVIAAAETAARELDPAAAYADTGTSDEGEEEFQVASLPAGPVSMATATLPSSAAEAFADVAPVEEGSHDDGQDLLGQMIERKTAAAARLVASADPQTTGTVAAAPVAPAKDVAPAREAARVARAGTPTGWVIQVGAVDSEASARALIARAKAAAGPALVSAEPMTEVARSKGQTFVRARFAGFASQKAAERACAAVKKGDLGCFALRL